MLSWRLQFKGTFLFLSLIRRFIFLLSVNFIYIKCDVFIKYYFLLLKTSSLFRWLDVEVCLCKILFLENFINFQLWVLSVISSYWKKIEKEMKFWIWNLLTELSEQWTLFPSLCLIAPARPSLSSWRPEEEEETPGQTEERARLPAGKWGCSVLAQLPADSSSPLVLTTLCPPATQISDSKVILTPLYFILLCTP